MHGIATRPEGSGRLVIAARQARITLMRTFSVYIVASPSRVIYVGVTNDLERRIAEHREKAIAGFTARERDCADRRRTILPGAI